ncbi:uncharacterized protein LOC111874636 isoform X2 [Cryptotermes secundus]|uniref:uncharacterized protein LOC111874636 isoform X2 n=1 Tax=Cryptotermes secundus TaxID=105785 RepID=UPI000CD7ABCC|nr:uncharacterized protein LOC111874636 isoform X2 [Cryptotermes secundus]
MKKLPTMHLFSTSHEASFHHYYTLILFTCHLLHCILAQQSHCNGTDTFVKVSGYSPGREYLLPLYASQGHAITRECYRRCKNSTDCAGFLVDYASYTCYRVSSSYGTTTTTTTASSVYGYHYGPTMGETNYFERICLPRVPSKCNSRGWIFERASNYEVVGFDIVTYITDTREQCMMQCLREARFVCRSAEFMYAAKRCVLSNQDRRTRSDSYRATPWGVEYLENQCIDLSPSSQTCSFEEHPNRTISYRDLEFTNLNQDMCHDKCVNETNFICRSLTYVPDTASGTGVSVCWLHSDDTTSVGPRSLKPFLGAMYMERAPCLDLMVICSEQYINVTLRTVEPFKGRIYVVGHSESCDSEGNGAYTTTLRIPLSGTKSSNQCGIVIIKSVGETNQTLISTVIVIQHNPIIQRQGDRSVKIGCLLNANLSQNLTVNASLVVTGPDNQAGGGTVVLNTTSVVPTVHIHIIDRSTGNANIREAQLGQELEFRIDVEPDNGPFDIMAGHLVATNEDGSESILLLNDRGCPPDPLTFPAFTKAGPNSKSLIANFRAFKFPRSLIVRFSVMVQFCPGMCPSTDCGNGIISYGRRRREAITSATLYEEMPLEMSLKVYSPQLIPSSLLSASETNGKILVGVEDTSGSVCIYFGAIIGLVIAWLLLQFIILIGCYFVVRERYKQKRDDDSNSMQHKLQDDFNGFDNSRHVHWADEGN